MSAGSQMTIRIAADVKELRANLLDGKASIDALRPAVESLAKNWTAHSVTIVQDARNIVAGVDKIGGATNLTSKDAASALKKLELGMEELNRTGKTIPAGMAETAASLQRVGTAASSATTSTNAMSTAVGVVAAEMLMKAGRAAVDLGKDALLTSARVETLAGVAAFMGQQAGYTKAEIDALASALQRQGITTGQSYDTIVQMVRANMSLADATKLATVAQGLARATGENSSSTLAKLIQGTQTLQVEVLRNAGVVIQLDQEYKKFAASSGRTTESLGAQEKQQIALAAVLREGEKVLGVYGVTNDFVGGKLQSMKRHGEEASLAIGDVFAPALRVGTDAATELLKLIKEYPSVFGTAGLGAAALATAFTGLKASAALGAISTGTLTTALGLLWPAVAVGATAFSSWKLGGWLGEVTGLTNGVEWLAGRMMGLSSADIAASRSAREYSESSAGKAAALAAAAKALADLEAKAQQAAIDGAKRAADEAAAQIATAKATKEAAENAESLQKYITALIKEGEQWDAQLVSITKTTHGLAVAWGKDLVEAANKGAEAVNASIRGQLNMLAEYQQKNELALLSGTALKLRQLEIEQAGVMAAAGAQHGANSELYKMMAAEVEIYFAAKRAAVTASTDVVIEAAVRETAVVQQQAQQMALSWSQAMDLVIAGKGQMTGTIQGKIYSSNAEIQARRDEITRGISKGENYWGPVDDFGTPDWDRIGLGYLPAKALGGPVNAGSPYLVGERGPEMFVPRASGTIVPNGAGMGGVSVVNHIYVTQPFGTPAAIAQFVGDAMMQRLRGAGVRLPGA